MIDLEKLKEEQSRLSRKAVLKDSFEKLELIGGIDCGYDESNNVFASIMICDNKAMEVVEKSSAMMKAKIPYIPGFLSYREAPVVLETYSKLQSKPDVILVDGNGILHPRKCGIATHIGVLLDIAAIGVAKTLLAGVQKENKVYIDDDLRAEAIVTRQHARPLYIRRGNKVSLKTSVEIVKNCLRFPHKLPEPLHLAHRFAEKAKDEILKK